MKKNTKMPNSYFYLIVIGIMILVNFFILPRFAKDSVTEVSYDTFISQTDNGQRFYKMSELQHISNDGTVDIYGALNPVDKTNVIEYFCNQAGFVSGIVITSSVPETIMFQGTVLMELASEDSEAENYDTIYKLIKYSIDNNCACGYHSYRTNRYYDIRTVSSYGIYMTKITAGIK